MSDQNIPFQSIDWKKNLKTEHKEGSGCCLLADHSIARFTDQTS